jgi:hypothetical protein
MNTIEPLDTTVQLHANALYSVETLLHLNLFILHAINITYAESILSWGNYLEALVALLNGYSANTIQN